MVKPCIKCGAIDRGNSGRCRPCHKIAKSNYQKVNSEKLRIAATKYRKANSEKIKTTKYNYAKANAEKLKIAAVKWKKANPEKRRIVYSKYRKANSEKIKTRTAKWRKANPEICRIRDQNRRALKKNNGGKLSPDLAKMLFERQKGKCVCCKTSLGKDYHLDHIMPLALGGKNEDWNMQLLKAECNMSKGAKHPVEYMQSRGLLL